MFWEKLNELMNDRGLSVSGLSKAADISYTTIDGWQKSGGDNIKLSSLVRLADFFNVSLDWFADRGSASLEDQLLLGHVRKLDGHGRRMVELTVSEELERMREERQRAEAAEPQRFIPHYSTMAAAGFANPIENEDYTYIPVTADVPPQAQFAVTISGDSMEPYIHDGQVVYCVKDAQGVHPGEIGIFCVDGAYYCKQYVTSGQDAYLVSLNRAREDADVAVYGSGNRSLTCAGRVIMDRKIPIADGF